MAVKSIRQVSQGERLLAPSVANTSQSNGNQKQVAKFSLPMIKNIKLFCCEYFAEAPAVKQRATRPWRKRWAAYSVLCFNVLRVEMGTAVAPCIITAPKDSEPMITTIAEYKKQHIFVSCDPKTNQAAAPNKPSLKCHTACYGLTLPHPESHLTLSSNVWNRRGMP